MPFDWYLILGVILFGLYIVFKIALMFRKDDV